MTAARVALAAVLAAAPTAVAAAPAARVHGDTREVRACLPLADGGALVGTGGGLVRVDADGAARAVWTARDGLPGTRVEALVVDGDDVWLGADGGAARLRLDGDTLTVARTVAGVALRDLVRHDGALYAATASGGVVKLGARGKGARVPWQGRGGGARDRVAALAVSDGALWAGTAAGLYALRDGRLAPVVVDETRPTLAVTSLVADGDRLWIATADGLYVRDAAGVRHLGGGELRRVALVDGAVVTAGLGDGLRQVDRGRLLALPGAPRDLVFAQAIAGRDGAACAGGLDGLWLRPRADAAWRAAPHVAGLPSNDVSALAVDGDRLWVGTFDQGLVVRERGAWRPLVHPDLDARINALLVEPRAGGSRLWVATAAGLMTVDAADATRVARLTRRDGLPGRGVLALARLRDGRIVAGTSTGAVIVADGRATPVGPAGTELGNVWAIAEDADGFLWLGTTTGVWRGPSAAVAKAGDRGAGWQRLAVATGHLVDDWVMGIVTRDRSVWVGGYKGGVVRFDLGADGAVPARTVALGGGWINPGGLRWDGDRLVAATQEGLRIGDGASPTWTTVAALPGKDVTAAVRMGTTQWIATRRGLLELPR